MSAPLAVRLDLQRLSLDELGLLARHPRASHAVRAAFVRTLSAWVRSRIRGLARTMRNLGAFDHEDIAQDFLERCLTRHLRQWDPEAVALSPFLFLRLRGAVIDSWRRRETESRRAGGVDVDDVEGDCGVDVVGDRVVVGGTTRALALESSWQSTHAAIHALPPRQRTVVRLVLRGAKLADVAQTLKVHPSTVSREHRAALDRLRGTLDHVADEARVALAAA
jgi:RNA polymerase sigma factor (sigma-70 family)